MEKDTSFDLSSIDGALQSKHKRLSSVPDIWVCQDSIVFTEIEAIKQFGNVNVFPFGLGGVQGREGGVSLAVVGSRKEIEKVLTIIKKVQGEKPFHEE